MGFNLGSMKPTREHCFLRFGEGCFGALELHVGPLSSLLPHLDFFLIHLASILLQHGTILLHAGSKMDHNGDQMDQNAAKVDQNGAKMNQNGAKIDQDGAKMSYSRERAAMPTYRSHARTPIHKHCFGKTHPKLCFQGFPTKCLSLVWYCKHKQHEIKKSEPKPNSVMKFLV